MKRGAAVAACIVACTPVACSGDSAAPTASVPGVTAGPAPTTQPTIDAPAPATATTPPASTPVPSSDDSTATLPTTQLTLPNNNTTTTTTPAPASGAAWCATAQRLNELTTAFRQLDAADAAAVEVSLAAILDELAVIADVAPAEVAGDLAVSTQAFGLLDAALAEVDYDLDAADLTDLDARADAIEVANDRIRAYNAAECGIDIGVIGEGVP